METKDVVVEIPRSIYQKMNKMSHDINSIATLLGKLLDEIEALDVDKEDTNEVE